MFLSTLIAATALSALTHGEASLRGQAEIPERWVLGQEFRVTLSYDGGEQGLELLAWQLTPAAFEIDGQAIAPRENHACLRLAAGDRFELSLDLADWLPADGGFDLGLGETAHQHVRVLQPVKSGLDFLGMQPAELAEYRVLMDTNRGELFFELWPEIAPQHVRNWLDLVAVGFYDGLLFHRVSPSFMIQGGCPNTRTDRRDLWGLGAGPRKIPLEVSTRKHLKGVLSMARGPQPDSASSQFFVITRDSPQLDGQYSAFGKLLSGYDALARIGNAPGLLKNGTVTPAEPQRILHSIVVRDLPSKGEQHGHDDDNNQRQSK